MKLKLFLFKVLLIAFVVATAQNGKIFSVTEGKIFFALPGSTKAVELAMTKLILPELKHLLSELRKSPESA